VTTQPARAKRVTAPHQASPPPRPQTHHGIPAYSFTMAPDRVTYFVPDDQDGSQAVTCTPQSLEALSFRWDGTRLTPLAASAIAGAAVAPAMGRMSVGSSCAVLAFANIRLGVWLPNPRYAAVLARTDGERPEHPYWFPDYPRIRLTYLFKELFGLHDPDDPYVYVTDGGHWENLGLAELVRPVQGRRRPTEVVCLDASGVSIESVTSLAEAIGLGQIECDTDIRVRFDALRAPGGTDQYSWRAERCVTIGVIDYGGTFALFWYAKPVLTVADPTSLLAYRERDNIFPATGTIDQFFDEDHFVSYRDLGSYAAEQILDARGRLPALLQCDYDGLATSTDWVAVELAALLTEDEWDLHFKVGSPH